MAKALLEHERIITTQEKAKEVRPFIERLITLARRAMPYKDASSQQESARYLHYYRLALKRLQDSAMVQKLFGEGQWRDGESLGERYLGRAGGYTRIVRLQGSRLGIPLGDRVGTIPKLTYEIAGRERTLKLTGNRLGDNASQVLFELVEKEVPTQEEEVAPVVSLSQEPEKGPMEAEPMQAPQAAPEQEPGPENRSDQPAASGTESSPTTGSEQEDATPQ